MKQIARSIFSKLTCERLGRSISRSQVNSIKGQDILEYKECLSGMGKLRLSKQNYSHVHKTTKPVVQK